MPIGLSLGLDLTGIPVGQGNASVVDPDFSGLTPSAFSVVGDGVTEVDLAVHAADGNNNDLSGKATTIAQEIVRADVDECSILAAETVEVDTETTVAITINDENGQPIPDVDPTEITLASTGTGNTIIQPTLRTNVIGETYATFESSVQEVKTLSATMEGVAITTTTQITVGSPAPPPDPGDPFAVMGTTEGDVRTANGGLTFSATGSRTTEQEVPAGRTGWGLRFRYGPDALGDDSSAQQNVNMGQELPEVWLDYDIHVPANFEHRNDSPSNNKFAMFWRTIYSDVTNGTWRVGFEYQTSSGVTPDSTMRAMSSRWDFNFWTDSGPNYSPTGQGGTFVSPSGWLVPGEWNRVRIHLKAATDDAASDGVQQMWVGDTLRLSITNGRFWNYPTGTEPADCWLQNMYFLGWANSGFVEETDLYIYGARWYNTDPGW